MSHAAHHGHDHDKDHGHDHHEGKPHGFLNTVFDETIGGFGILLVSLLLISIFLILILG